MSYLVIEHCNRPRLSSYLLIHCWGNEYLSSVCSLSDSVRHWERVDDKAQSMPSVALRRLTRLCRDSLANGIKARFQVCFSLPVKTKFSSLPGKNQAHLWLPKFPRGLQYGCCKSIVLTPETLVSLKGLLERIPMPYPSPRLEWDALVWIPNQDTGEAMGGGENDLIILVLNSRVAWWAIPSASSDADSSEGKRSRLVSSVDCQTVCPLYAPHSTLTTAQWCGHVGEVPERVSRRGRWPMDAPVLQPSGSPAFLWWPAHLGSGERWDWSPWQMRGRLLNLSPLSPALVEFGTVALLGRGEELQLVGYTSGCEAFVMGTFCLIGKNVSLLQIFKELSIF